MYTSRTGRQYQPGIGPHAEDRAVDLIIDEMQRRQPDTYKKLACRVPYQKGRQTCDIVLPNQWLIEVKMARFFGDNGKPDDTGIKDVLSPFEADRSALSDVVKLATAAGAHRRAILIYGFDAPQRPLGVAIDAFERLAPAQAALGQRVSASFAGLVHPVFQQGGVFGWEVMTRAASVPA